MLDLARSRGTVLKHTVPYQTELNHTVETRLFLLLRTFLWVACICHIACYDLKCVTPSYESNKQTRWEKVRVQGQQHQAHFPVGISTVCCRNLTSANPVIWQILSGMGNRFSKEPLSREALTWRPDSKLEWLRAYGMCSLCPWSLAAGNNTY